MHEHSTATPADCNVGLCVRLDDGPYHGNIEAEAVYRRHYAQAVETTATADVDWMDIIDRKLDAEDQRYEASLADKDVITIAAHRGTVQALAAAVGLWTAAGESGFEDDEIQTYYVRPWASKVAEWASTPGEESTPPPRWRLASVTKQVQAAVEPCPPGEPGRIANELLRVPGFVSELMDYTLGTAPYPNVALAFAGALAMQSHLAGRKIRDSADIRGNLYVAALAFSGSGKDHPRKVNARLALEAGIGTTIRDRFASGPGIEDALESCPALLFQPDEIDGLLRSVKQSKDGTQESIVTTLLSVFSASNGVYVRRAKAGELEPKTIDQPHLSLLGTCNPVDFYESLASRLATNGLLARFLILEAGQRGAGQEPSIQRLPPRVVETAQFWARMQSGGDLQAVHPEPAVVPSTDAARDAIAEHRRHCEERYAAAESSGDRVATAVWARAPEICRKLALLYAASERPDAPEVSQDGVVWGADIATRQAERLLFMTAEHSYENEFDALCKRAMQRLRAAPGGELPHWKLLKALRVDAKTMLNIVTTLENRQDIVAVNVPTKGRGSLAYRLK